MGIKDIYKKSSGLWSLIIIATIFYIWDSQNLYVCDDFRYAFVQGDNRPVVSLFDAIESQVHAYKYENGRFLVHTIVQCFAGFGSMDLLRVFNTFFFVLIIGSLACMIIEDKKTVIDKSYRIFIVFFSVLLAIPVMGYSFLGNIACSVNYLWTAALSVCFLNIVENAGKYDCSRLKKLIFILFSVIVGSMQESFSIGLSVGLFVSMLVRKDVSKRFVIGTIAYCVGAALVILAPSNFMREATWNSGDISLLSKSIHGICSVLFYCHTFMLMCIALIAYACATPQKAKTFFIKNLHLIIAIFVSALFVACVAFTGPHQLVSIELFSMILILKMVFGNIKLLHFLTHKVVIISGGIFLFFICVLIGHYRGVVKDAYEQMILSARQSTDGCMIGGEYDRLSFSRRNWFVKNYTSTELNQDVPLKSLSMYLSNGKNESLIRTRLPQTKETIVQICSDKRNKVSENTYKTSDGHFYVIKLKEDVDSLWINESDNYMSKLRDYLLGISSGTTYKSIDTKTLNSFQCDKYKYYIVYNNEAHPVTDVSINKR